MHPKIKRALDLIEAETAQDNYDLVYHAVRNLVEELGEDDLADRLMDLIPVEIPPYRIAMLFNFLAWQTDDNGAANVRAAEQWLRNGLDLRRCQVALGLDVYPFADEHEMYRVLSFLATVEPKLTSRCKHLIASRRKLNPSSD